MSAVTIIGVDCATQPAKTGLAIGQMDGDQVAIRESLCASRKRPASEIIASWSREPTRVLLAMDAPLGWPAALSEALAGHQAGQSLRMTADQMSHRVTDDEIHRRLGNRPLEVGANLIARTAHAALSLLARLRQELAEDIPLAWDTQWLSRIAAIEVYPAATRRARGAPAGTRLLEGLDHLFSPNVARLSQSPHAQDAILCVLAGADFLRNRSAGPTTGQMEQARREGWIWVPDPEETKNSR
jgi:uncharacterized protein DUF429